MLELLTVLGPTASGKTELAVNLAFNLNGEIISADSRQVYKGMDIGTGKDLEDYKVKNKKIPYHLIDIHNPGYQYNIFEFQKDFYNVLRLIKNNKKLPVLCGGSGMYVEAVLNRYKLLKVPENEILRKDMGNKTIIELKDILTNYKILHNKSDLDTKERVIRAIEIEHYYKNHSKESNIEYPKINNLIVGVQSDRLLRRRMITERLVNRLENGMIDEVKSLLDKGLNPEQLIYYGLEYKFITLYIIEEISYNEMFDKLNTAIHQFAKRQMTWYRKMERDGHVIKWIDATLPLEDKVDKVLTYVKENNSN